MLRAPLAVTLGDPAGVGPEIIAAAWRSARLEDPPFVVFGDHGALAAAGAPVAQVQSPGEAAGVFARAIEATRD